MIPILTYVCADASEIMISNAPATQRHAISPVFVEKVMYPYLVCSDYSFYSPLLVLGVNNLREVVSWTFAWAWDMDS